ncbi:MAG TPA: non-ribosomal peptide synthetase [Micromonosporaceae bacterium]|nr:non-ribosomal peptide synthetase [Micromonosporaceae bacterium]
MRSWREVAARHRGDPGYVPFPAGPVSIADRFWQQVYAGPQHTAVLGEAGALTYQALGDQVAAVAAALAGTRRGAGRDRRVAVLLDHGAQTVAGILGALTAGAAYVPLDPEYPADRLVLMLADADADTLLTSPAHGDLAQALLTRRGAGTQHGVAVLDVTRLPTPPPGAGARPGRVSPVDPDDAAYILYTSGSTGVPKGVVQTHRNALFQIGTHVDNLRIGPGDRVSVLSSFSFDMAVTDTFSALLSGATSVPVDLHRTGLGQLAAVLSRHGVTVYHSTPTVYRYLVEALGPAGSLPSLRAVVLGGEQVVRDDLHRFRRHCADDCVFVNGYGATEISFAVQNHLTAADIDTGRGVGDGVVPVGHPLDGVEILLLPAGAGAGEIAIRSRHLATYWQDPQRNAQRFQVEADGRRTYRTGDLGRWLPDGRLAYLGRTDRQVKVRGHRVEPGEVEAALAALPEVSRAAVVAHEATRAGGPEQQLVAYVVPAAGGEVHRDTLRECLNRVLPPFAVPQAFVPVEELPLTPTGKVDVRALPDPSRLLPGSGDPTGRDSDPTAITATGSPLDGPAGRIATVVADAWRAVLGRQDVGWHDNFFDLGGHSLLMAQVQERVAGALGRPVPLTTLYAYPTVAALAGHLAGDAQARTGDRGDIGPDLAALTARRRLARAARDRAGPSGPSR